MAVGVKSWSTTAANNATASSAINWAEGQLAPTLNNSARALMAEVAAWRMQFGGISYGGSGNAYTATNNAVGTWSAYAAGDFIGLLANHTNSGAATINVDGLGAKNIVTNDGGSLVSGDITSGALVLLVYDGTSFQLVGSFASGSYQPLDATLTALAGVTVAADKLVYATGADAFATTDFTSFARTLVDDADAATARATLGLTIGTHVQAYDADLSTWAGVTPGTGVATALAINTGSTGAFFVNGVGTLELGHASDTTVARSSAGVVTVEGKRVYTTAGLIDFAETQAADAVGTRGVAQNSQSTAYTLVAEDAGKHILHPASDNNARTFTIPANGSVAYPVGTVLTFINLINTVTIAITTDTMTLANTATTGSRTLAVNGIATAIKVSSTSWIISGTGLT
jgi:hypothetical protein